MKSMIRKAIDNHKGHPENPSLISECPICDSLPGDRKCKKHSILNSFLNSTFNYCKIKLSKYKDFTIIKTPDHNKLLFTAYNTDKLILCSSSKERAFTFFINDTFKRKLTKILRLKING